MIKNKNAALGFIFVTVLLDIIGIGIIIPVLPTLIDSLSEGGLTDASWIAGWMMFTYAFMQFLFAPVLGGLSDRYGRRPVLLLSLLALGVNYVLHAYAPTLIWLFIGRVLSGIGGASYTTAMAYVADISTAERKSQNFGMIGAAFGLGFIIGPLIGGISSQWGIRAPFIIAASLSFINMLYGFFILPESLGKKNRRSFELKRANPLGSILHAKSYPMIIGLFVSYMVLYLGGHAIHSTWNFYTMFKLDWDEKHVGYSLAFVGLLIAIIQGGLIRVIVPKIGQKRAVYLGLVFEIIGLVLIAFANSTFTILVFTIPYALGGIAAPSMQGIISNKVASNEQGELQGTLTSLVSITSIIGPLLMTGLFYKFSNTSFKYYFPGAPFLLGALLILVSLLLAIKSFVKNKTN